MSIATTWTITFTCGHSEARDLSGRPAGKRARLAAWYGQNRVCSRCFTPSGGGKTPAEKAAGEAEHRAAAERDGLPVELVGSDKQVAWALRVRHDLIRDAYEQLVQTDGMAEEDFETAVLEAARPIDRASWWIDNRETNPGDLPELLADPGTLDQGATTENVA